jgi:CubicO group peptidase (beta-lactamase class C family)
MEAMPNRLKSFTFESVEPRRHLSASLHPQRSAEMPPSAAVEYAYAAAAPAIVDLKDDVYGVVHDNDVPGGQAAVIKDGAIAALGANGKRVAGKKQKVTTEDRFHLGSAGKAMTSTMVARLIELGQLDWETKIVTVFPELKGKITASFENVTVWQLMTNRSGISDNVSTSTLIKLGTVSGDRQHQRAAMVPILLKTTANGAPGAKFEYSNFAYALLGAMAERATGSSFESLMYTYVFKPLKMDSAGFGAHGKDNKTYDPRGHDENGNPKTSQNDDMLPYLAPAGTMTMSVIDWGKFLKAQMGLPTKGKYLLKQSTLDRLHTPYNASGTQYAAGWVVTKILGVTVLSHDGTNGNWYSTVQLIPSLHYAVFDVVNQGGTDGMQAAYDLKEKAIDRVPYL